MGKERAFAAIDVGTTKVCTIVGRVNERKEANIIGVGVVPARGLRKGNVVNIDEATETIRASVEKAERSSGYKIASAKVGITGSHINSVNNRGIVAIAASDHQVSHNDVLRALESARAVNIPSNKEVLHVIPRTYILDGQDGVRNPVGMYGRRLDVETHIIAGATTAVQNLVKCVERVNIKVEDLILEPLASSEAVLTDEEKEMGVVLADIGGGTTDVAIFIEGSVYHTAVLPVGGYQLTNDLAIGLRTPFATAEDIKIRWGSALTEEIDPEETVEVGNFTDDNTRSVLRRHLCQIVRARTEEILEMIFMEIKRSGYDSILPAGLVLTGGTANLRGLEEVATKVLQMPVRIGVPRGMNGLVDTLKDPAYATSIGLLMWGGHHQEALGRDTSPSPRPWKMFRRIFLWMRELVP